MREVLGQLREIDIQPIIADHLTDGSRQDILRMACDDVNLRSGESLIKGFNGMGRLGRAVRIVVIRQEGNSEFRKGVGRRVCGDFGEEEEVDGRHVVYGLLWCRGLEALHHGNGVVHGCRSTRWTVAGTHAVVISVRGQHVVSRKTVNEFGLGAGGVQLSFLAFRLQLFRTAGKVPGRPGLKQR